MRMLRRKVDTYDSGTNVEDDSGVDVLHSCEWINLIKPLNSDISHFDEPNFLIHIECHIPQSQIKMAFISDRFGCEQ